MEKRMAYSPFFHFSRKEWCGFRGYLPLVPELPSFDTHVSLEEIKEIYVPLSQLLNLYIKANQALHQASREFLGKPTPKVPFLIGITGSVAVGKSTASQILQALLSCGLDRPKVALVTTDGFLYPLKELERRGLLSRKGFPESFDNQRLIDFLAAIKSGEPYVCAPVYSHHLYDIVPDQFVEIEEPDIVIVEGLNILQTFVSDFFDFTIFVDAHPRSIQKWFTDRVFKLRKTAFQDQESYFNFIAQMSEKETLKFCQDIWRDINEKNLYENILATKNRARLILYKGPNHDIQNMLLRKL